MQSNPDHQTLIYNHPFRCTEPSNVFHCGILREIRQEGEMLMEKQLRKTAIKRYVNGEDPKSIYTSLKRSKPWFFKWLRRSQSGKAD